MNMSDTHRITARLRDLVGRHNRELALEAAGRFFLGLVFSFLTFGFLFCLGWLAGWSFARSSSLQPWQLGAVLSGVFLVVAAWSAWRKVNPLAGLQRLTDGQWLLTQLSLASPSLLYFSPRHAVAGIAEVLLAGPSSVFQALGLWTYRLSANPSLIGEAAQLLTACSTICPVEEIRTPAAALLLSRLTLIKVVPLGESTGFTVTDKGSRILSGPKVKKSKPSRTRKWPE